MGVETSTLKSGGTLRGSFAPPLRDVCDNQKLAQPKTYKLLVPKDKRAGDSMTVAIGGKSVTVRIPPNVHSGSYFMFKYEGDINKVIASTLPAVPGMEIVQAKPIIWGSVSHAYFHMWDTTGGQQSMGQVVGNLMQQAQTMLLEQALEAGCNAVLGVTYNITNDSSGEKGNKKMVIVTCYGTPCTVIKAAELPVVQAEAVFAPLNNF